MRKVKEGGGSQTYKPKRQGGYSLYLNLDDILDHIRTFLSIIIILSTSRDGHIALKGFYKGLRNKHRSKRERNRGMIKLCYFL